MSIFEPGATGTLLVVPASLTRRSQEATKCSRVTKGSADGTVFARMGFASAATHPPPVPLGWRRTHRPAAAPHRAPAAAPPTGHSCAPARRLVRSSSSSRDSIAPSDSSIRISLASKIAVAARAQAMPSLTTQSSPAVVRGGVLQKCRPGQWLGFPRPGSEVQRRAALRHSVLVAILEPLLQNAAARGIVALSKTCPPCAAYAARSARAGVHTAVRRSTKQPNSRSSLTFVHTRQGPEVIQAILLETVHVCNVD